MVAITKKIMTYQERKKYPTIPIPSFTLTAKEKAAEALKDFTLSEEKFLNSKLVNGRKESDLYFEK